MNVLGWSHAGPKGVIEDEGGTGKRCSIGPLYGCIISTSSQRSSIGRAAHS